MKWENNMKKNIISAKEKCNFYDDLMSSVEPIWDDWCDEGIERDSEVSIVRFVMDEYKSRFVLEKDIK